MAARTPKPSARQAKVAVAIATGQPKTKIAEEEGVSRSTIHRDAASPEVQQILARLVSEHDADIRRLFTSAIRVLTEAMDANGTHVSKDGNLTDTGADHYARLTAVLRFIKLTSVGRPTPAAPEIPAEKRTLTLIEFQQLYREQQIQAQT